VVKSAYDTATAAQTAANNAQTTANSKWSSVNASTSTQGIVKLTDSVTTTSSTLAATATAVKAAKAAADTAQTVANGKWTAVDASTSVKGIVQLNDTVSSTSTTLAATANAVKQAYDKAAAATSSPSTSSLLNTFKGSTKTYSVAGQTRYPSISSCSAHHSVSVGNLANSTSTVVYAWGKNSNGQLGNNTTTNSSVPINVSSYGSISGKSIVAVAAGYYHTIALDSTGAVHAWGWNGYGQLGNNTTTNRSVPINVSSYGSISGKSIVAVAAGDSHTIALDSTGAVHAWGTNNYGLLGNGTTTTHSTIPIQLSTSFVNFTGQHRCFIDSKTQSLEGRIVITDKNTYVSDMTLTKCLSSISVNDALPLVSLSMKPKDKRVFGVVGQIPTNILKDLDIANLNRIGDVRKQINSVGEGAMWIADINGPFESGDYITSSSLPGYGMRQEEQCIMNYTVAKATMDCDFTEIMVPSEQISRDADGNAIYDSDGNPVWEVMMRTSKTVVDLETGEEKIEPLDPPEPIVEPKYLVRFLNGTGEEITKEEYDAAKVAGTPEVFKAAFVGCTYHCG